MKKLFIVLVAVLLFVSVSFSAESGKLIVWCSEMQVDILKKLGVDFEAQNGIPVEVLQVNFGDIKSKFLTAAPAGEGPDIIVGAHDWTGELAANGLLLPLNFMNAEKRAAYMESALKGFEYGGYLYGLPYSIEAIALIYNKELIEEAPVSFEEFMPIAADLTDEEYRGFVYNSGDFYFTAPLLFAAGGYVFKETSNGLDHKQLGLANEGAIIGGELLLQLYEEGILKPGDNYDIMNGLFLEGLAGAIINGPWAVKDYQNAGIDYGIAPIPSIQGYPAKPFTGVQGFMINSKSPNTTYAVDFLSNFIDNQEVMYKIYLSDPRVPARLDVLELVKENPDVIAFSQSCASGTPMPNIPSMNAVWGSMAGALSQIINKQLPPEAALKEAVEKIIATLNQ